MLVIDNDFLADVSCILDSISEARLIEDIDSKFYKVMWDPDVAWDNATALSNKRFELVEVTEPHTAIFKFDDDTFKIVYDKDIKEVIFYKQIKKSHNEYKQIENTKADYIPSLEMYTSPRSLLLDIIVRSDNLRMLFK